MGPPPRERIQVEWHRCNKRLALTCSHLSNNTSMEGNRSDQLDVVGNHVPCHFLTCDGDLSS